MTFRMISNGGHRYRDRMMEAGEEFEVDGQTQRTLMKALKWAADAPDAVAAVAKQPDRTVTAPPGSLAPAATAAAPASTRSGGNRNRRQGQNPGEPAKPVSGPSPTNDEANKRPDDDTPTVPRDDAPHSVGTVQGFGRTQDTPPQEP